MRNRFAKSTVVLALTAAMLGCGGGGGSDDNSNDTDNGGNGNPELARLVKEMADSVPAHRDVIMSKAEAETMGRSYLVVLRDLTKQEAEVVLPLLAQTDDWQSIEINNALITRNMVLNPDALGQYIGARGNVVEFLRVSEDIAKELAFMMYAAPATSLYLDQQNQEWFGDPPGILTFEYIDPMALRAAMEDAPEFAAWWEDGSDEVKSALKEGRPIEMIVTEANLKSVADVMEIRYSTLSPNTCSALDKALNYAGIGYCDDQSVFLHAGFQADLATTLASSVEDLAEYIKNNPDVREPTWDNYVDDALPSRVVTRYRDHFAHEWRNDRGITVNSRKIYFDDDAYGITITDLPPEACIVATGAFLDQGIYEKITVNFESLAGSTPEKLCEIGTGNVVELVGYVDDEVMAGSHEGVTGR